MNKAKYHFLSLAILLGVTFLTFHKPLLTSTIPLHTDGQFMTLPSLAYFRHWALRGVWPVWWVADSLCGNMADGGPINPSFLIFTPFLLLLRLETAWFLLVVLQFLLAGLCMYFYLNHRIDHWLASLFGALLFMRAEAFVDSLDEPQTQFFFLPLILLCLEKILETLKLRYVFLTALLLTLFFTGPHAYYPLYLIPLAFFYFFVRTLQKQASGSGQSFRPWLYGILVLILFLSWSWFRTFILVQASMGSARPTLEEVGPLVASPTSFFTLLFPDFFKGGHVQFPYIYDRALQGIVNGLFHTKVRLMAEFWYPGFLVPFFLCCAWSGRKAFSWSKPCWMALFGYLLYLFGGEIVIFSFLKNLPLINMLQHTYRIVVISILVVPILSATGFWVCVKNPSIALKWSKRFLGLLASFFILFLLKDLGTFVFERYAKAPLAHSFMEFIRGQPHYQQPEAFYLKRAHEFWFWFKSWAQWKNPEVFLPLILYLTAAAIFGLLRKSKLSRRMAGALFFSLLLLDSFILYPPKINTLVPLRDSYPTSPAIRFLQQETSLFRFLSVKPPRESLFPSAATQFLPADKHLIYGLASVHGYQALVPKRYHEVFQLLSQRTLVDPIRLQDAYRYEDPWADFLNIKYVVTKKPDALSKEKLVFEDEVYRIYENSGFFPRAFLVGKSQPVKSAKESLEILRAGKVDFRKTVLLEGAHAPSLNAFEDLKEDKVVVKKYSPHEVLVETQTKGERVLILTDSYHPAWRASIDGNRTPISIANHAFRGVVLPPGRHIVRFKLEPFPLRAYLLGVIGSFSLALLVFLHDRRTHEWHRSSFLHVP